MLLVEDNFLAGDDVDAFSLRLGLLAPEQVVAFVIHPAAVYRFSAGGRLYGANARDEVVRTIIYIDGRGGESERQRRIDVDGRAGSKAAEGSLAEGVGQGEAGVDVIGYLERLAQCRRECLDGGRRVAEGERGSFAVPGCPAIDVGLATVPRVAAHPVHIGQDVRLLLLPADAVGQVAPKLAALDAVHEGIVGINLHHAAATGEGAAHLAHDVVVVAAHAGHATAVLREHEAVRHEVVDGAERRVLHEVLIDEAVAIRYPLLAAVALIADGAPVHLLPPHGIGHLEPEGRRPGADGGVEEDVGLHFAQLLLDVDDAFGILLARHSAVGARGAELRADAVELEVVEVVRVEHEACAVEEDVVVGGVGELHAASRAPVVATVVAALSVAADGPKPCADLRVHTPRLVAEVLEAFREVGIELPCAIDVPAVVPDERADADAVRVEEVKFPLVKHRQALRLVEVSGVVLVVVAVDIQFEPRVVHWEGTPRHGTFALAVAEEGASRLSRSNEAHHGSHSPCLALGQRRTSAPLADDFGLARCR